MPRRTLGRLGQAHREGLRFLVHFSLYTVLAFLALYALHEPVVVPFTRWIAWLTHGLLRGAGVQAWASGAAVGIPGFAVEIKNNCNAIYEIGLYGAAVWAYPAPLRHRAAGMVVGASVLYVVNLLRVLSLLALGRYWPGGFQVAHLYVWQALFLAIVGLLWLTWTARLRPVA